MTADKAALMKDRTGPLRRARFFFLVRFSCCLQSILTINCVFTENAQQKVYILLTTLMHNAILLAWIDISAIT